jgi:hypothetical protein
VIRRQQFTEARCSYASRLFAAGLLLAEDQIPRRKD